MAVVTHFLPPWRNADSKLTFSGLGVGRSSQKKKLKKEAARQLIMSNTTIIPHKCVCINRARVMCLGAAVVPYSFGFYGAGVCVVVLMGRQ